MSDQTVKITRTVQSALESPRPDQVIGTVLDPTGGIIELPITLVNFRGRNELSLTDLFDPEEVIEELPGDVVSDCTVRQIDLRPLPSYRKYGIVYLNRIQVAANRLIDAITNYKTGTHPNIAEARKFLQGAFSMLEDVIIDTMVGKGGLITRHVMGLRLPYSMMTPAAGTHSCEHDQVLIPLSEAKKIKAWDDNIIMVHREPLLHGLGIVFLRAKIVPDHQADSTRIPWCVFLGMNADCDGDLIFLTNITEHLKSCSDEDRIKIVAEINRVSEVDSERHAYSASLMLLNDSPTPTYKNGSLKEDLDMRLDDSLGLSFGAEDIFGDKKQNQFLELLEHHLGIDPARIMKYATDMQEEEWAGEMCDTAKALCYTKRGLGIVGAIGSYALVIASAFPACIDAAVSIKERLSQTVLDAKHGEDLDHINECLDALMKTGKFEEASHYSRIDALVRNGFDKETIAPLFYLLADQGIVTFVYQNFPGFLLASGSQNLHSLFIRFSEGEPDIAGPGADAGAWWDQGVLKEIANAEHEKSN